MEKLNSLVTKVLTYLEPDENKWEYWLSKAEIEPVSQSECIEQFVSMMSYAKENGEKVIVAGDYDCDGIMATTIMVDGLRRYGIECGFYIPDRIREGYGLNENTVRLAHQKGYGIIVTVDNGVKAHEALDKASEYGMMTVVTDHHTIEGEVDCDVLVHPTLMEPSFSTLCGAGVAYECMRALGVDTPYHLECAAIASIGDVMVVKGETRAIIQKGIESLNHSHEKHVFTLVNDRVLNEQSIAFQLVPKLNAIGRLSNLANVNNVVRFFLSEDIRDINAMKSQIINVNDRRKQMSDYMLMHAEAKVNPSEKVIMVSDPGFHEGIIGLVAGSLCAKYNKPVIIFAENTEGYKASMRSPEGFDCMEFLRGFELFSAFGGHAQAAGFSLDLRDFAAFKDYVRNRALTYKWKPVVNKSILIEPDELNVTSIESLDQLRPFGAGFQLPEFEIMNPDVRNIYDIQGGKHRKYTLTGGTQCMHFNQSEDNRRQSVMAITSFTGSVSINQYQGRKEPSFIISKITYK